jgi:hypothetical protein
MQFYFIHYTRYTSAKKCIVHTTHILHKIVTCVYRTNSHSRRCHYCDLCHCNCWVTAVAEKIINFLTLLSSFIYNIGSSELLDVHTHGKGCCTRRTHRHFTFSVINGITVELQSKLNCNNL